MKIDRQSVFNKYNGKCAYCGHTITLKTMQVDHCISKLTFTSNIKNGWRIPKHLTHLSLSDLNYIDNLMPACRSCNNYKSASNLEMFRNNIYDQPRKLRVASPMLRLSERFGIVEIKEKPVVFYFETLNNQP